MNTTVFHDTSSSLKVFDALILSAALVFNSAALGVDWQYLAVAVGGSLSGAVILAYFRRDSRKIEQVFKAICASISGMVIGAFIQEHFQIERPQNILAVFFFASLLSLVLLRSLLVITERNAGDILRDALQRLLNLQTRDERQRRRNDRLPGEDNSHKHQKEGNQ